MDLRQLTGIPRRSGTTGSPNRTSGGTTVISSRCSTMCALSRTSAKPSSGEPIASQRTINPSRKDDARQPLNCTEAGLAQCQPSAHIEERRCGNPERQPERYRPILEDG